MVQGKEVVRGLRGGEKEYRILMVVMESNVGSSSRLVGNNSQLLTARAIFGRSTMRRYLGNTGKFGGRSKYLLSDGI